MNYEEWGWLWHICTEEEWRQCDTPQPLLTYLRTAASNRKFRLYAAACARRVWSYLPYASRHSVEVAERFADGQTGEGERAAAEEAADDVVEAIVDSATDETEDDENDGADTAYHATLSAVWCARSFSPDAALDAGHAAFYAAATEGTKEPYVALLQCVFGNPFSPVVVDPSWLSWNDGAIPKIAQAIYDERAFDHMAILADALEEAGCDNADILAHLRSGGAHVRGCWPVDLILGKS